MAQNINITCPISPDRVNENVARTAAFFVIVLTLTGFLFGSWPVFFLLAADFALRSFSSGEKSPIRIVSKWTARQLKLQEKPTDAAPKKFAAGVGFVFSLAIGLLLILGWQTAAFLFGAVLFFCAALEGFIGFCVGCIVYTHLVIPFTKEGKKA